MKDRIENISITEEELLTDYEDLHIQLNDDNLSKTFRKVIEEELQALDNAKASFSCLKSSILITYDTIISFTSTSEQLLNSIKENEAMNNQGNEQLDLKKKSLQKDENFNQIDSISAFQSQMLMYKTRNAVSIRYIDSICFLMSKFADLQFPLFEMASENYLLVINRKDPQKWKRYSALLLELAKNILLLIPVVSNLVGGFASAVDIEKNMADLVSEIETSGIDYTTTNEQLKAVEDRTEALNYTTRCIDCIYSFTNESNAVIQNLILKFCEFLRSNGKDIDFNI